MGRRAGRLLVPSVTESLVDLDLARLTAVPTLARRPLAALDTAAPGPTPPPRTAARAIALEPDLVFLATRSPPPDDLETLAPGRADAVDHGAAQRVRDAQPAVD